MARDTTKKALSAELEEEVYQLWAVQDWSFERISGWLEEKHQFTASREWVRRLIDRLRLAKGGVPDESAEPESLDEDQQLHRLQCDAFKEARRLLRRGETAGWSNAAKVHIQAILARKKLREEPGAGAADPAGPPSLLMDLPGVGVSNAKN